MQKILILFLCSVGLLSQTEAQSDFEIWPVGSSPAEVGSRVAELFLSSPHGQYSLTEAPHVPYFEVCTWYGALTFAAATGNKDLQERLIQRFEPLFAQDSALLPIPDHVDLTMFGSLPLEIYLQTGDERYRELGLYYANKQWEDPFGPRVTAQSEEFYRQGLTWQTRLWIDDMYMITIVQAQAYRATGDTTYLNRAAREMVFYLDKLQRPDGLFYHAADVPFYWGRGNGWMAAGMTELLRVLPPSHRDYPRIMEGYQKMMATLLEYQTDDGLWRQLIDDDDSWEESSCTGMFSFAMITGIKHGWLDANTYAVAARMGWMGLVTQINDEGAVRNICEGTGANNNRQYYYDRQRKTGDLHGQAPVLWCASALLRDN